MRKFLNYLQVDKYFLGFIFLLSYVFVVKGRIIAGQKLENVFLPDGPVLFFFSVIVIFVVTKFMIDALDRRGQTEELVVKSYIGYFAGAFFLYIIGSNVFSFVISIVFDTVSRNFNRNTFLLNNLSRILEFFLFGGIYIAYLYFQKSKNYIKQINEIDKSLSASKIQQLRDQLNPHFLFNNLNTLDQLIEEDKDKASNFLINFSELYRYSLEVSDNKLVEVKTELEFARSYFAMMQEKFLGCYFLEVRYDQEALEKEVPPFCLQVLVENAIEHNFGSIEEPVSIVIAIGDRIAVSNNKILKKHQKKTGGRALKNLSNQFSLLGLGDVIVEEDDLSFKVFLPLKNC
ncbi:MAG: histidine kinase [Cyclobacteriaceae bacterium]